MTTVDLPHALTQLSEPAHPSMTAVVFHGHKSGKVLAAWFLNPKWSTSDLGHYQRNALGEWERVR